MRVFLEASRGGSVSAAAEQCNLSQPAATQALSRLEADLGATLLIRRRGQFALTESGAVFEKRAAAALRHLSEGGRVASGRGPFGQSVTAAQLRNLIAIANTGSFTVAARTMGLSQPTVHRTARHLEALAGQPFFLASATGVQLTPAAEGFVRAVKLARSEIKMGVEEISQALGREKSSFVLGSLPLARTSIVPKAIHTLVTARRGVQVRVVDGRYSALLRALREGDIDCLIGALRRPAPAEDVEERLLFRDALTLVAHPTHPLAQRPATLKDTLAYPWIAPPKETPAGQYLFETLRIQDRAETPVRAVSSSMAVLRGILAEGDYISVVSAHQVEADVNLGLIARLNIPLTGHIRHIGLTYRRDWRPTKTQDLFIQYLSNHSPTSV
ncbi:MAG: LysR family transcriptional regulator [Pseudomonadota bacterium]